MSNRNKVQLVSMDYMKQRSPLPDDVNADVIQSAIIEAQELMIEPKMGTNLYNDMLDKVYDGSISGDTNYTILLEEYIQPALVWSTMYLALVHMWIKPTNKGLNKLTSEYSESVEVNEISYIRNIYKEYMDERLMRLYNYLVENDATFTKFGTGNTGQDDVIPGDDLDLWIMI